MSANEAAGKSPQISSAKPHRRLPQELSILAVLAVIVAVFEIIGWPLKGQSFFFNSGRLSIIFLQVAVIGIPDDHLGEEVGAAVALKDGYDVDGEELQAFAKERLAAYKYPRAVWIVDELPKGPTGKILRREVEAPNQAQQQVEQEHAASEVEPERAAT